jgi:uncharacterized repeat protein (TIGR04076 family)
MFKVKCTLINFEKDEKKHPCHFNYKIGDAIYYDGVTFTGRVCPGIIHTGMPVVHGVFLLGNKYSENIMFRYRGPNVRDSSMAKYDGVGFRPVKEPQEDQDEKAEGPFWNDPVTGRSKGAHFLCGDHRTLAHFKVEPVDLATSEYAEPFYRRSIAILEKIEAAHGMDTEEILDGFTRFEREGISPVLTPVLVDVILEALADVHYIDFRDGKAYATGKEPPVRPGIGSPVEIKD